MSPQLRTSLFTVALSMLLAVTLLHAQDVGPSAPITLDHADSLRGYQEGGQEINEFIGNVRIRQGVVNISADRVMLYQASNRAVLTGNVVVTQPGMTLNAPRADYNGATRIATAPVGLTLKEDNATLTSGSGSYHTYERIAYFNNGVTLTDGKATVKAGAGEYYSLDRKAIFRDGVTVLSDSGTITARQLTYWRDTEESFAVGNVVVTPKGHGAKLTGDTLRNIPARNYTLVLGSPRLVQVDTVATGDSPGSTRRDTTIITSAKMEAFRAEREEYVATDNVHLTRGDLEAVARLARFLPGDSVIALGGDGRRGKGEGRRESGRDTVQAVTGRGGTDSSGGVSGEKSVMGEALPIVWYDRSQLTGDTITVGLSGQKLRTIDVVGNAFAVSSGDVVGRYDQLAGVRLFVDVLRDTIRVVQSEGAASSIYFMSEDGRPNGVNRASGDTMRIAFDAGQVSRITIHGRRTHGEGEYFPESLVVGQESAYRLEGFRWIDRATLLRTKP